MNFGPTPLEEAEGTILAHTLRLPGRVIKKGTALDAAAIAALREDGRTTVVAARLERGDVPEDAAADRLAEALRGPLLASSRAATGRVNLLAETAGLLVLDAARIDRINAMDESLTVATLPNHTPVAAKEMVATIKVIPFSAPGTVLTLAETIARGAAPPIAIHPFRPLKVGLVLTELPGLKDSVSEKTIAATRDRVEPLHGTLLPVRRTPHEEHAAAAAFRALLKEGADMLLLVGASAVVDRRDTGPAAIQRAGGTIHHFGMPVDPGNLLCLGEIEGVPAIVLPGCARSPKLNGFDWVLQRLFAGLAVTSRDIMAMGVGGLLNEIETRPMPRGEAPKVPPSGPAARPVRPIAAVVLAAGRSRRMAPLNKLLVRDTDGTPMVARVVDQVLASQAHPVIVVTGHERAAVEAALAGRRVSFVHAPDYADGLSASLKAGLAAVPPEAEGVMICLGDMPLVSAAMLDRLIAAFDPEAGRAIVMPTYRGKQGNPMLWAREFLPAMLAVTGDVGARHLAGQHADRTATVEMADDAVLRDFDTVAALAAAPGVFPATK